MLALDGIVERNELNMDDDIDYINAVCGLASLSAQLRNIAQAMIDARFPEHNIANDTTKKDKKQEKKSKKESQK